MYNASRLSSHLLQSKNEQEKMYEILFYKSKEI